MKIELRKKLDVRKIYSNVDEKVESTVDFVNKRLARTSLMALKFMLPSRISNPFEWSGVLTFVSFFVLAFTGGFLTLYYVPTFTVSTTASGGWYTAFDSVYRITYSVAFGYAIRSIHYWAANVMILAAFIHLAYYYVRGRYKNPNEIIWVTGMILGTLTILEAYTGYDLIMNARAIEAISIGRKLLASLQDYSPLLPAFNWILEGQGIYDIVTRFYGFHLILVPFLMLAAILVHFPKNLKLDVSSILFTLGVIVIAAGVLPVPLGTKYIPGQPLTATVPEWYLSGLYALLRSGGYLPHIFTGFVAGVAIPAVVVTLFIMVPFLDKKLKRAWFDRTFYPNLLAGAMASFVYVTILGFLLPSIPIRPDLFYTSIFFIGFSAFAITYGLKNYYVKKAGVSPALNDKPSLPDRFLAAIHIYSYQMLFPLSILFLFVAGSLTWVAYTVMIHYGTTVGLITSAQFTQYMHDAVLYGIPLALLFPTGVAAIAIWIGTKLNPRPKVPKTSYVLGEVTATQIMSVMFAIGLVLTALVVYSIIIGSQFAMLVDAGGLMIVFGGAYHIFRLSQPVKSLLEE
ncbi:MAG: cytochrome b N-terminal domain-containing protein [Conexivisphaerales archaeon]